MRLIDADKLKERIIIDFDLTKIDDTVVIPCIDFKYNIDFAPTVEAIPIEWIKQWSEQFYKDINGRVYYMGDGYDTIWDMLEDWEKENERR